jgi:hypothetical protein
MSTTSRTPLIVALVAVSAIAILEGVVILLLLGSVLPRAGGVQSGDSARADVPTAQAANDRSTATTTTQSISTPPLPTEIPSGSGPLRGSVGERMESAGFVLTVLDVHDEPDPDLKVLLDLSDDERYLSAEIVLENRRSDGFFYGGSEFRLKDKDDYEYVATLDYRQPGIGQGTLGPGERVRGLLSYIVPLEAQGLNLIFQAPADSTYRTIYIALEE